MKKLFNLTDDPWDLKRFSSQEDLRNHLKGFYGYSFDGIELMHISDNPNDILLPDMVIGYHFNQTEYWLDFWRGRLDRCLAEYDTLERVRRIYGGEEPLALARKMRKEFDTAISLGAEYVVIHVSNASTREEVTGRYEHTDEEVIHAFTELINEAIPAEKYPDGPWMLLENLWLPGMNLTNPEITAQVLENINYKKKGIMLDTGHLLHTNLSIRTQKEGVKYIHQILDRHGKLCRYIKGVHLQQSLTGSVMRRYFRNPPPPANNVEERMNQLFTYVFAVDQHKPFTGKGVKELIRRIGPDYLNMEFITNDLEEHRNYLKRQIRALL